MALVIDAAIAKTNKYASRESGDTAELVERPGGGISLVIVDGQGSGAAAKTLSLQVSSKAVGLLKDGVRDGAVARAAHDSLFAYRHGKVSATIDFLSVDLKAKSVVATRNSVCPLVVIQGGEVSEQSPTAGPIGLYHFTRPVVAHFPIEPGLRLVACTDGIFGAGAKGAGAQFDVRGCIEGLLPAGLTAQALADAILAEAVRRDNGRPGDDMTVAVLGIGEHSEETLVREMSARMPLP